MATLRQTNSSGRVPFLWEQLPGISKAIHDQTNKSSSPSKPSLPPPPCLPTTDSPSRLARRTIYVPLPPCPFVPMQELSSSRKGMKKMGSHHDDPFFAAFVACTKRVEKDGKKRKSVKKKMMDMRAYSCKYDVGVRENVMIRVQDEKKVIEVTEG